MRDECLRLIDTDKENYGKKHRTEIELWAKSPEGTKVWCKRKGDRHWCLQKSPSWLPINEYVVDNENAIQRMAELDASMV